jgi:hypothetical protein
MCFVGVIRVFTLIGALLLFVGFFVAVIPSDDERSHSRGRGNEKNE